MEELLKQFLVEFREFKTEFQGFKAEFQGFKTEFQGLKTEFQGLKTEFNEFREETNKRFDTLEAKVDAIGKDLTILREQFEQFEAKTANNHIEIVKEVRELKDEIMAVQLVTGRNMADIAYLKLVK